MIQAVFFDFNGVIIDDEPLHLRAFGEALREEGIEQTEAEYFDSLGMDDATFVRAAFERAGRELSDEVLRRVIEREAASHRAALEKDLPLFPGVIVSAADWTACKPDPCCYTKALELLNARRGQAQVLPIAAEECLVVEDSPPGIRSARAAGMRTPRGTNTVSDQALRDAGADVVTRSLADWTPDAVHHVFN